jgi:hypothetical protein
VSTLAVGPAPFAAAGVPAAQPLSIVHASVIARTTTPRSHGHVPPLPQTVPVSRVLVVALSDSFSQLWPQLASAAGARCDVVSAPADAAGADGALAVILSVAGVEEEGEPAVRALIAAGAPAPVVVGARDDHRLAAALVRAGAADYLSLPGDLEALKAEVDARA